MFDKTFVGLVLLQDDGSGRVWVHNNKQGFVDCEPYALLEDWLSKKTDEYLDKTIDKVFVVIPTSYSLIFVRIFSNFLSVM